MSIKKNWIAILSFTVGILILAIVIQYSQINHIKSRLDTTNETLYRIASKDSLINQDIKLMQIKEDMYIKQQDRDTNLILWVIAIVFGLFSIISYSSFTRKVEQVEKDLNERYSEQSTKFNRLAHELNRTKADLDRESGIASNERAFSYFETSEYDRYLLHSLLSSQFLTYSFNFYKDEDEGMATSLLNQIKSELEGLVVRIKALGSHPSLEENLFMIFDRDIREIDDPTINSYLSTLFTLINLTKSEELNS